MCLEPFEQSKFLTLESQSTMFKILHFEVKFCDLAQVGEGKDTMPHAYTLAVNNNPLEDFP